MDRQTASVSDVRAVADWRRRVAETYAGIRSVPNHGAQAWMGWRAIRDDLLKTHDASPLAMDAREGFKALDYFDYDPALRFLVETQKASDPTPETVELADDGLIVMEPALETIGLKDALGAELTVYWITGYGGGLFLPFSDATTGDETFGGGRYLLDAIKGADLGQIEDGRLVIDFNFSYNPSCAYSPRWSCPLAPERNRLPNAVRAGEKNFAANA